MDAVHIGALDIGGTKLAAMVAGPDGPKARTTDFTVKSGSERALPEQALRLLDKACTDAGIDPQSLAAIGVASAGPFVTVDGMLALATPNICGGRTGAVDLPNNWHTIPLEAVLRERYDHVVIENDCVAGIAAERTFGAVRDEPDCVYVTWSTGVGFGLCVDGHILHGKHGNAGHAGHMLMSETDDALCGCGNRGDLEALISGRNIANRLGTSTAELFRRAREGEPDARNVVEEAARRLGRALYNMTAILDTRTFVIGGSVWQHHGEWLSAIVEHEVTSRLPALTGGVRILPAHLGVLVADVGAFSLVVPPEWVAHWRDTEPWRVLTGETG